MTTREKTILYTLRSLHERQHWLLNYIETHGKDHLYKLVLLTHETHLKNQQTQLNQLNDLAK